jgi:hypothetical protein
VKAVFHGIPVFNPKTIRRHERKLPQKQMLVPACPLCKTAMCFPQLDVVGTYEPEEASDQSGQVHAIKVDTSHARTCTLRWRKAQLKHISLIVREDERQGQFEVK